MTMTTRQATTRWLWSIPVCVAALLAGQVLGVALVGALGLELPRVEPTGGGGEALLLIPAALAIALALAVLAVGLSGRWWERAAMLAVFLYGVYGLGTMIETTIFTTLGGQGALAVMHLPGSLLGGLAAALLFPAASTEHFAGLASAFVTRWRPGSLIARLGLAVLAFPIIYLVFGAIVAPVVTPYYRRLDFLVLPAMAALLRVAFTRSVLFLLVSLPVIVAWRLSRTRLMLALGVGHFVAVGLAGLIEATFFPAVLRWAHGVEILADSICYAAVLAWLLFPRPGPVIGERAAMQERLA
jgi:hypothetical protein